jgi:hypothetical protein
MKVLYKPNQQRFYPIENTSWPEFATTCKTGFSIEHANTSVSITFDVQQDYFKAQRRSINSAVHKDNCVEFFIQFSGEESYYNIEFNCLGIGKLAYGTTREKRQFLPVSSIKKIGVWKDLRFFEDYFDWQIKLYIPVEVFIFSAVKTLKGLKCKGNFYKCGDDLPRPHYLAWNKIDAARPDFHLPEFFGNIDFE